MHPEVPESFSLVIGADYSICNVAVRGSPVLCTTSLLPSQPMLVLIYTRWSRRASYSRVPCSRTQHAANTGLNSRPWDHESGAQPLSYARLYPWLSYTILIQSLRDFSFWSAVFKYTTRGKYGVELTTLGSWVWSSTAELRAPLPKAFIHYLNTEFERFFILVSSVQGHNTRQIRGWTHDLGIMSLELNRRATRASTQGFHTLS